jgi:hypothetical protein
VKVKVGVWIGFHELEGLLDMVEVHLFEGHDLGTLDRLCASFHSCQGAKLGVVQVDRWDLSEETWEAVQRNIQMWGVCEWVGQPAPGVRN